jgi:hypothetical protein
VARRPLKRELVCLDGGRRTTQLMRDSLGANRPLGRTERMLTSLQILGLLVTILGAVPSGYFASKARRRLSAKGEAHPWIVYWLGVFAGADEFTPEGWKYHKRFVLALTITGLIALPLLILGSR